MRQKTWNCKVGFLDAGRPERVIPQLPKGADAPMRKAVETAIFQMTRSYPDFCISGWDGKLTTLELSSVLNHSVSMQEVVAEEIKRLKENGLLNAVYEEMRIQKLLGEL